MTDLNGQLTNILYLSVVLWSTTIVTDRPIEIDLFGQSERLVWTTKQSSDQPTNNIRHVKYFAQKSQRPIDVSVTLDVCWVIFGQQQPEKVKSACGTVISESQRNNFATICLISKPSCGLICCYIVLYFLLKTALPLPTNYKIKDFVVSQNVPLFSWNRPLRGVQKAFGLPFSMAKTYMPHIKTTSKPLQHGKSFFCQAPPLFL